MLITGFEKVSLVDYDGHIACTLFCGGCNFRCPFCHNGHLVEGFEKLPTYSEREVFDYLHKRKGIIEAVVISGGEPTLQPDLVQFAQQIKALGLAIKLDTNGTRPDVVAELYNKGLLDYVAMDIKCSREGYPKITNVPVFPQQVFKCADYLINGKMPYEFRTTLVDGFFTEKDIYQMCDWLKGARKLYLQRFVERESCLQAGLQEIPISEAERFRDIFIAQGINCELRNYS